MKNMYEVFEDYKKAPDRTAKINVLRWDNRQVLKNVLQGAFHPGIQYVIKSAPSYKKPDSPPGMGYTSIEKEMNRVYMFVEGSKRVDPNLTLQRKTVILAQMLEAMEAKESEVFMGMILKDLNVPGLTAKEVEEAFPGLLS
jgi:hypothetical protein